MQTGIPSVRRRRLSDGRFRDGGRGRVSYVFLYRKGPASNKRGNNRRSPVEGDSADGVVLRPGVGAGPLKNSSAKRGMGLRCRFTFPTALGYGAPPANFGGSPRRGYKNYEALDELPNSGERFENAKTRSRLGFEIKSGPR